MGATNEDVVGQDKVEGGKKEKKKRQKKVAPVDEDDLPAESTIPNESHTNKKKQHRSRKKHHFNAIRSQMEFYFGDSNLSKDRFLKQLIDKDPFVPLEVFLTFNKLKALTGSVEEIAKSLANSKLLELDETHQKVRRNTALPIPAERNVDEKTLYVEALPPSADHDWVRQTFERFGAVTYVSLPKYAKSRKIKEFGFVEFEQEHSVEKAVKAFREFNGVLCMVDTDPAELTSVKSYIKEQNNEEDVKEEPTDAKITKRKTEKEADASTAAAVGEPKAKRVKTADDDGNATATVAEDEDDTSASETAEETADETNKQKEGDSAAAAKKKRRKKKKKSKSSEKRQKDAELNTDAYFELKVLPKRDWKRLRNKYLNLQREKIAGLKRKAWKEQQQAQQQQAKENDGAEAVDMAPSPAKKAKPTNERRLHHRMNMNFYGAGGAEEEPQTTKTAAVKAPLFSYEPGIIVEVGFMEPCVNVKEFKADMRQYTTVKYVDVKEGTMHAHLRLETATAAVDFLGQVSCAEYKCRVLAGEPESEYWKKIELDREMKLNKQVKVPQKRGREKVKKLVEKQMHIRFGDDDDAE